MAEVVDAKQDIKTNEGQKVDDVQALKAELEALRKEKSDWSKKKEKEELSLNDKVKLEREDQEKKNSDSRLLEAALTFNLTSQQFLKDNESILPKEIGDIFKAANQEKYENAIQKSNATKAAIIQSFFSQQSNVDYLTEGQKLSLADYLKLTKNGKEDKAREIYDNLFEPALGTLKRVKKAEELSKSNQGLSAGSDSEQAYKDKLSKMAERKFFRGKH